MYTYLAGHVGRSGNEGAFRALERGYNHWASGRIQEILINTNCPPFCYVKCKTNPSMKSGTYVVYILLKGDGGIASIASAMCDCAAGFVHNLVQIWQKYWQIRDNLLSFYPQVLWYQAFYFVVLYGQMSFLVQGIITFIISIPYGLFTLFQPFVHVLH